MVLNFMLLKLLSFTLTCVKSMVEELSRFKYLDTLKRKMGDLVVIAATSSRLILSNDEGFFDLVTELATSVIVVLQEQNKKWRGFNVKKLNINI